MKSSNVPISGGEIFCDHSRSCLINYAHTTSSEGDTEVEEKIMANYLHSTLQVGRSDSQYFKQEALLSAFPCTVRANLAVVSEEMFKSILCHISNRQPLPTGVPPRPTMGPALPFYLHSGWQPKSSWLSLIGCQRLGIQHPPRRNSLGSSTAKEGLGRQSTSPPYTIPPPQRMNLCRLPVPVSETPEVARLS